MVWKERSRVDERVLLVGEYLKGEEPMSTLARQFGGEPQDGVQVGGTLSRPGSLVDSPIAHARPSRTRAESIRLRSKPSSWRGARIRTGGRARFSSGSRASTRSSPCPSRAP